MAVVTTIKVFGVPPEWEEQQRQDRLNGIVRYHETEWLEWELPKEIEKSATKFIEKELKKFHKKCQCENCKNNRTK
jgi:hypothetical protein